MLQKNFLSMVIFLKLMFFRLSTIIVGIRMRGSFGWPADSS